MEPVEAAEIVGMITIAFPIPAWEFETQKLWQRMLSDLDVTMTTEVVERWIRTRDERPTIAAIRRGVADRHLGNATGAKLFLPPDEAWEYVQRQFGATGQYNPFPDEHPLVKEAVERMGWIAMCRSDNLDVLRGQFRHAYTPLLERSLAESAASEGASTAPAAVADMLSSQTPQLEHDLPRLTGASRG